MTSGVGTPIYQSPEQLKNLAYNEKVDIYAIGLILFEMLALFKTAMERDHSLRQLREQQLLNKAVKEKYELESDLIIKMTKYNPQERPSACEIIESNEFQMLQSYYMDNK